MAVTKTHPIKSTLKAAIDYILNPEKTDGKLLASSFGCGLETADIEFAWTREAAGDRGTHLGRHLIQSFAVGETTPEEAHKIGMELAGAVLGGKYEFVLTTHVDKDHLHNHLIFNAVSFVDYKKYHSNKQSYGSTAKSAIGMLEAEFWKLNGAYKYIDTMICCSEFLKTKMDSNPLFAQKTVAMHNFVDKVEWKDTPKKDYILYFGRFSKEKGIDTLIQVCKQLPDVPFIFAGTGPLESELNNIPNIKNLGFQRGEALEKLIREARFSVYPSEWYENCPFSVMESQMYGTPVLGANIGGIPELITVGKTGALFESGNAADLEEKILALWSDHALTDQYTKNCKAITFDTIETYYNKLLPIYCAAK